MPTQLLNFEMKSGMNVLIAKEQLPNYVFQKIVNLELSKKIGRLIKRKPYTNIKTELYQIAGIDYLRDANGQDLLVLLIYDSSSGDYKIEYIPYSGGTYGSLTEPNDERDATDIIEEDNYYPVIFNNELRAGCGNEDLNSTPVILKYLDYK